MSTDICTVCGNHLKQMGIIHYCNYCNAKSESDWLELKDEDNEVIGKWKLLRPGEELPKDAEYGWNLAFPEKINETSSEVSKEIGYLISDYKCSEDGVIGWKIGAIQRDRKKGDWRGYYTIIFKDMNE